MSASKIAVALAAQKYWSSSLSSQASRAVAVLSQRLAKPIAEWAAQDGNHANLLQQASYALAKKEGVEARYGTVPTNAVLLTIPPIKAPKPTEAESIVIDVINAIAASECHNSRLLAETAQRPDAQPIFQVLDLDTLAQTSADREQSALEMIAMIKEERLFQSREPVKWRCLQCGARTHSKKAFESCACCKGGRAFATCTTI